jgi:hypothetical protein
MAVMRYLSAEEARWNRPYFRGNLSEEFKTQIKLYDIKNQVTSTEQSIIRES